MNKKTVILCALAIIATQIGCAYWIVRSLASLDSSIYYNLREFSR